MKNLLVGFLLFCSVGIYGQKQSTIRVDGITYVPKTQVQRLAMTGLKQGTTVFQSDGAIGLWVYNGTSWTTPFSGNGVTSEQLDLKADITLANQKLQTVFSKNELIAYTGNLSTFDGSQWEKKAGNVASNGGVAPGTIINVSASFYWKRKTDIITPEMFGADGTDLIDDLTAFRNCYLVGGNVEWTPQKSYILSSSVEVFSGTITNGNGSLVTQISNASGCFYSVSKTNIQFNNIRIQGKGTDAVNNSTAGSSNGIFFSSCTYFSVKNSKIKSVSGACILVNGISNNFSIENNEIEGSLRGTVPNVVYQYGMGLWFDSNTIDNFKIINNEISFCAIGIVGGNNITNFQVIGNKIHDIIGQHGIYFDTSLNGSISENILYNINSNGIKVQIANLTTTFTDNLIISKNNIKNCKNGIVTTNADASSIGFQNVQITNNVIDSQNLISSNGIQCELLRNSIISDNIITNSKNGIYCFTSKNVKINNNLISGSGDNGIRIFNSEEMQVLFNSVKNVGISLNSNEANGIFLTGPLTKKASVIGNLFIDEGAKMEKGLFLFNIEQATLTIKDNKVSGFTQTGYELIAGQNIELLQNNTGSITNLPTYYKITENEFEGTGTPNALVAAKVGSRFYRLDGATSTTFYIKETGGAGNTGWVAK